MANPMSYCTYIHSSPQGKVFYVGKGNDTRPFAFSDRSDNWKRAIKQHGGILIDVVAKWDTEEEAFEHEKFLIECFDNLKVGLVNKTKGGKGTYGLVVSEEAKQKKREKNTGFVHKKVTCPNCGKNGGETSMKRWHFDKCQGLKEFRARVHVDGKRIHLGRFATQEEADQKAIEYYASVNKPLPKEFLWHKGMK